jgi:hypothetical protein
MQQLQLQLNYATSQNCATCLTRTPESRAKKLWAAQFQAAPVDYQVA